MLLYQIRTDAPLVNQLPLLDTNKLVLNGANLQWNALHVV